MSMGIKPSLCGLGGQVLWQPLAEPDKNQREVREKTCSFFGSKDLWQRGDMTASRRLRHLRTEHALGLDLTDRGDEGTLIASCVGNKGIGQPTFGHEAIEIHVYSSLGAPDLPAPPLHTAFHKPHGEGPILAQPKFPEHKGPG